MTAMDMEARKPVLRLIKIKDGDAYLNADRNMPIPLSHQWTAGDLFPLVMSYCQEYDVDPINDEHVRTLISRAVLEFGNGKEKVNNLLLDAKAPDVEKRQFLVEEVMMRRTYRTLEDTDEILYREHGVYKEGGRKRLTIPITTTVWELW